MSMLTKKLQKADRAEDVKIVCESEHGEMVKWIPAKKEGEEPTKKSEKGYAGVIVLIRANGNRDELGRTDPTFKTADQAVASVQAVVDGAVPKEKKPVEPKKTSTSKGAE